MRVKTKPRKYSKKRGKKSYYRAKTVARKSFRRTYNGYVSRSLSAFPKIRYVRHTYCENITLPAAGSPGGTSVYTFMANSMYDPNNSGTGHQPLYRDEMAALYTYYTVISSAIHVTLNQSASNQSNYGILLGRDASLPSDPTTIVEQYGTKYAPFTPAQKNSPVTLHRYYNAKKWLGVTGVNQVFLDDTQRVSVGSNPGGNSDVYFVVWRAPIDASVTLPAEKVQVKMHILTAWRNPQDAVQS